MTRMSWEEYERTELAVLSINTATCDKGSKQYLAKEKSRATTILTTKRNGQPWTINDDEILLFMVKKGCTYTEMSKALERTYWAIRGRRKVLGDK